MRGENTYKIITLNIFDVIRSTQRLLKTNPISCLDPEQEIPSSLGRRTSGAGEQETGNSKRCTEQETRSIEQEIFDQQ